MTKHITGLMLAGLIVAMGCNRDDQMARQKGALESRRAEVTAETDKVLGAWIDTMAKTLPADVKKYPKVKSALVPWRLAALDYDWRRPLGNVLAKVRSTPFETEYKGLAEFFEVMEKFWKKEVDFKDYMEAFDRLKATSGSRMGRMLADFDHTFVHVDAFYQAQDMEGDDRAIIFFRHWQVAFHFPRERSESVSDYLARLCKAKLSDYCSKVPFEQMHFALEKPYLERVREIVGAFLKDYPGGPLNRVFEPFLKEVDLRLAAIAPFEEFPVLPDARSRELYVGDLFITVSNKGIEYEGENWLDFNRSFALPSSWKKVAAELGKAMDAKEKERGPENMELISLRMARDVPMGIAAEIVEMSKSHAPRLVSFAARRRMEGISRLTLVGRLRFREVPLPGRKVSVEGQGTWNCLAIGQSDDTKDLSAKVDTALILDASRLMKGSFANGRVVRVEAIETSALQAMAQGSAEHPMLLLVGREVTADRFLSVLEPLHLRCLDKECNQIDNLKPRMDVQVCEH